MCGIAGSVNIELNKSALDTINHRGPDYQALAQRDYKGNTIYMGHTRLSILDLSEAGNQPMFSDCGNYAIVFNGEIYNHLDLRQKLDHIKFRGHSDTETILYYIREFGIDSIDDFNGIFAFGFYDFISGKLFLARDHFGVKPVYYHVSTKGIVFSSELKVLLKTGVEKEISPDALDLLLTLRYNPSPDTIFKNIFRLKAAHILTFDIASRKSELSCYWETSYHQNKTISENEAIEEYQYLFANSIKRQLLSDVPVGIFLSGGLDSALVGKVMMENARFPIQSFTVGFEGEGNFNELADARVSASLIGSEHHEEFISQELYLDYFRKSFYNTEEPIAEPTIPALYHVSKMASKKVKVVLSGQGADEPMAGYKRYKGEQIMARYSSILRMIPNSILKKFFSSNETYQRGIYSLQFRNELERFMAIYTIFTPETKAKIYKDPYSKNSIEGLNYFSPIYSELKNKADSLNSLLYIDTRTMLPDNLLLFNDKIAMAHSIENRVPFLDKDLVRFVESLPSGFKLNGNVHKYLEKKAALKWLTNDLINRKKRGFETPVEEWFKRGKLYDEINDLIGRSDSLTNLVFNKSFIQKMIEDHKIGRKNYKKQLFVLYSLELWYNEFYLKF